MVAKIRSGKSLMGAIYYNENKLKIGKAKLLKAPGYLKSSKDLSFKDKVNRLTDLASRNQRTQTNTVHISLNFSNRETIPDDRMKDIAADYMKGLGLGEQPYLLYRHLDAGHPHLHIVTTNITRSGERISLHNIGRNQSEQSRKEVEEKYGLIKAEKQNEQKPDLQQPLITDYGKGETKRMITNVLGHVLRQYKFTSIPELNIVLGRYHMMADQGPKESRMYTNGGLVYWMLDEKGERAGVPIKASSIYGKPTLPALMEKFHLNEVLRKRYKQPLIEKIEKAFSESATLSGLQQALARADIESIFRRNEQGRLYGVSFVDHTSKTVFNGSDLGKNYSANLIAARYQVNGKEDNGLPFQKSLPLAKSAFENTSPDHNGENVWDVLFKQEHNTSANANSPKKKRRKKRLNL